MEKNNWKKIKSKVVHKNPWYSIREDDVIMPSGRRGRYFVVDDISSVAIIAEDEKGRIYMVGQNRYPVGNKYSWEIITGGAKESKSPLLAAKKELEEEAGVRAKKWIRLGYAYPVNGYASEITNIYLAENLTEIKNHPEDSENITVKKMDLKEILKGIKNNKITCGLTIFSIAKYLIYKNKIKL
jgi:8-oxo-dGTP pyrophosphatase MutT (NUDIX family)